MSSEKNLKKYVRFSTYEFNIYRSWLKVLVCLSNYKLKVKVDHARENETVLKRDGNPNFQTVVK